MKRRIYRRDKLATCVYDFGELGGIAFISTQPIMGTSLHVDLDRVDYFVYCDFYAIITNPRSPILASDLSASFAEYSFFFLNLLISMS